MKISRPAAALAAVLLFIQAAAAAPPRSPKAAFRLLPVAAAPRAPAAPAAGDEDGAGALSSAANFPATPAAGDEDFTQAARAALEGEKWPELERLARARLAAKSGDEAARAFLACALAGERKFDDAAAQLSALKKAGCPPDSRSIPGLGVPIEKIINIIYMTCWANFDAGYNEKAWSALFDAFEESPSMATAAQRLLMAALIRKDAARVSRFEEWFRKRIAAFEGDPSRKRLLEHNFVRGYIRAGACTKEVLEMAADCYEGAFENAKKLFGAVEDPLERREKCDISADTYYWDFAQALYLAGAWDPPENSLAQREPEPGARFEDVTAAAGLGGLRAGRVAAADYDGDGFPDLCFSGRLFRSKKGKKFIEVTKEAGLGRTGSGALFFDYDNDGDLDILVTASPHPFLYRNKGRKGKFAFEEVTKEAGLDKLTVEASPEGAAVVDIDGDGRLDFYLAVYENPFPKGHPDLLARNNGDGTFSDVSQTSGIGKAPPCCGRGVTCADFDGDGDRDIYVSNYRLLANFLWLNDGRGVFTGAGAQTGLRGLEQKGAFGHTIGSCWGDIDNDGDLDLFCANLAHPRFINQGFSNLSMLYVCSPPGTAGGAGAATPAGAGKAAGAAGSKTPGPERKGASSPPGETAGSPGAALPAFADERRARGIRFQETHSDPAFADYDNDGDLDLFITAIYVGAPSCFYQNDGKGFFEPVAFRTRSVVFNGWGQAWFDMEGDGDLDHVVASTSGVALQRNLGNGNKWLAVKLRGKKKNIFGVGSRVTVTTDTGLTQVRELRIGRGTQSQDGFVLHFGLGPGAKSARVEVSWPSGHKSRIATRPNRVLLVRSTKEYPRRRRK